MKICWFCVSTAIAHESATADLYTHSRPFPGYTNPKLEKQCFMYCDPPGPGQVMNISVQARRYRLVCTDSYVQPQERPRAHRSAQELPRAPRSAQSAQERPERPGERARRASAPPATRRGNAVRRRSTTTRRGRALPHVQTRAYRLVGTGLDVHTRAYRFVGTDLNVQTRVYKFARTDLYVQARVYRFARTDL